MSEYELVKKLGSYDNFKGLKSMAKVPRHKLFAWNKLSVPTVVGPPPPNHVQVAPRHVDA